MLKTDKIMNYSKKYRNKFSTSNCLKIKKRGKKILVLLLKFTPLTIQENNYYGQKEQRR